MKALPSANRFFTVITLLFAFSALPQPILAGWETKLADSPYSPPLMLAIDKDSQKFFLLTRKSPLSVTAEYPCTTGQATGDKAREGDLKTPEGVYFIEGKIEGGLDYDLYGDLAFPLNFPNPVDRIRGKTGGGIWVHGRGKAFTPRETRGCVALSLPDLKSIQTTLAPGTPVVIAKHLSVNGAPARDIPVEKELHRELRQWARDWELRSERFFGHYEQEAFTKAQGTPFEAFRQRKERIFASQPWLQVFVGHVGVLAGPDYWVTCFDQLYRSPALISSGRKRLYWQKSADGQWRIVGREFAPGNADLLPDYMEAKRQEVGELLEKWRQAWKSADLSAYLAFYEPSARQDNRQGLEAIAEHKEHVWGKNPPADVFIERPTVELNNKGLEVRFLQTYAAQNGYSDKGVKTMVLEPRGASWAIVSESWEPLS